MTPPSRSKSRGLAARLLPASLAPAVDQARRDLATVWGLLRGQRPPVLVPRPEQGAPHEPVAPTGEAPPQPSARARAPEVVVREPQPVEFRLRGHTRRVMAAPGQTVLDAGLSAGLSLPYSCTLGGCATCQVTLCEGEVWMEEPNCLTDEERARRQVLMCVSRPVSPVVVDVP